ncbi:hypothetical protein T261_08328 [Streptomyces lydicus]|nr:hypothetical protein T261_08328 [Streptomyces lydicus]
MVGAVCIGCQVHATVHEILRDFPHFALMGALARFGRA